LSWFRRASAPHALPDPVLETERLVLRPFTDADAPFVLALLNEPSFLEFIGDRGVRTLDDARAYLEGGPLESYRRNGFGPYRVELRGSPVAMGLCGLLERHWLDHVDLGFAFLPRYWSRGYALEAARAVMRHARDELGLGRVLAVTTPGNQASIRLLGKLGFEFEGLVQAGGDGEALHLFASEP
jgi:RimJ/RimL family protein N-acetyltransferase